MVGEDPVLRLRGRGDELHCGGPVDEADKFLVFRLMPGGLVRAAHRRFICQGLVVCVHSKGIERLAGKDVIGQFVDTEALSGGRPNGLGEVLKAVGFLGTEADSGEVVTTILGMTG